MKKKTSARARKQNPRFFTVGHSNRSISDFIELLQSQKLKLLIDVRKIPKSRHNPQFWGDRLAKSLKRENIEYIYLSELGGRRPTRKDSVNGGWRNSSFKSYADYMQSAEFQKGLKRLISLSRRKKLVIMCAEAVPWRCHRRLIADALLVHGHAVVDIFSKTVTKPHELTPFAKVNRTRKSVTYPPSPLTKSK
jgi:uncharacterized protein (DUF488 family)